MLAALFHAGALVLVAAASTSAAASTMVTSSASPATATAVPTAAATAAIGHHSQPARATGGPLRGARASGWFSKDRKASAAMHLLPAAALLLLAVLCGQSSAAAETLLVYETAGTHYEVGYNVGALTASGSARGQSSCKQRVTVLSFVLPLAPLLRAVCCLRSRASSTCLHSHRKAFLGSHQRIHRQV